MNRLAILSRVADTAKGAWSVIGAIVLVAGLTTTFVKATTNVARVPDLVMAHDSAMRVDEDTVAKIMRAMVKEQHLTNCILLGLEPKIVCVERATH